MRQVVLDTETTGLEVETGHRVIEIGCVELVNRRLTQNSFHRYINPQRAVDQGALDVHGIGDEFLVSQPLFSEVAGDFLEFVVGISGVVHDDLVEDFGQVAVKILLDSMASVLGFLKLSLNSL